MIYRSDDNKLLLVAKCGRLCLPIPDDSEVCLWIKGITYFWVGRDEVIIFNSLDIES